MPGFFRSRAGRQCLSVMMLGTVLWLLGAWLQFGDGLSAFVQMFDDYGAEKLVLAFVIAGAMSFIYSILRIADLRQEMELRAAAQFKADWTATHDHLTKLPNRYAFERKKLTRSTPKNHEHAEAEALNVTVFSVDLDGFKKVNDLVGHKGGDILLIEVARRICSLGNADCVYRFGGDEFVIIGAGMTEERERHFARVLIQAVTRPISIDGFAVEKVQQTADQQGRSDVSWTGVALRLPDDGTGALPLLRHVILNDQKSATYKLALQLHS